MGLSAAFEIGKAGLKIFQVASEVVSENIANVNTPGYSRQRIILESAPPSTHNGFPLGTGVKVSTVERYYDSLLQKQLVNAGTTGSYDTTKSGVLQQIEPIFNEVAQEGLGASIAGFFNAWQDLSINPTGQPERQAVLSRAQIMVDQFHYVDRTLSDAATAQNDALPSLTNDINSTLKQIALLNGQIDTTEQVSGNANEMRDQRDYLIRDLAARMGVQYTENADGTTDVYVTRGATTINLVKGTQYGSLTLSTQPPTNYTVTAVDAVNPATTAVVDGTMYTAPNGGQLWATLQMRDTFIPAYQAYVNNLANVMVNGEAGPPAKPGINAIHNAGFDLNGAAGLDLFTVTAGSEASTIALNPLVTQSRIAASGSATASGDNSNALSMVGLQSQTFASLNAGTFNSHYNTLVAQVGVDVQSAQNVAKQDAAFMKQLTTLRDSSSGVSLDEELANLIQYQRSYQASAKLITTATEMMDTLIGMLR